MIDCARHVRKKPNVLLVSAFAHLRLRFPFVSSPHCHPTPSALEPEAIPSPAYIASCLVASSLRSPSLSSPSRRIALIPSSQNVITSLTHELRSAVYVRCLLPSPCATPAIYFHLKSSTRTRLIFLPLLPIAFIFLQNKIEFDRDNKVITARY